MNLSLHFTYPLVLYIGIPVVLLFALIRCKYYAGFRYTYSLASSLHTHGAVSHHPYKKILYITRLTTLLMFVFLLAKPQLIDPKSNVVVNGIDIVLVLDISGSMNLPHHGHDERSRITVAKEEAIRFIKKRTNDAIGIVLFGNDALSRCPLTVDKKILTEIVRDVEIGLVNPEGTVIAQAIITAANRLRYSKAASKIMILLTDGEPSGNDINPDIAIQAAQQLGIKIYTIGIGSDMQDMRTLLLGFPVQHSSFNVALLERFARETGGRFFQAKDAKDMRMIYDTIDALEKTEIESSIFSTCYDWFIPFVCIAAALLFFELCMTTFIWFGV
ncbi:MAG TPA: VWA domain-containing protein [Candidatus Babeliales bacterium]|nr:VWA domain-containing protein [Candidatus Babeliales bacterium]